MIPGVEQAAGMMGAGAESSPVAVEKEAFLKLLVAQISNQDPMSPQDSEQYVQQLTQFSTLEQLMNLNGGVENLTIGQLGNNNQEAIGFVGKTVIAKGGHFQLPEEGAAEVGYRLHEKAGDGAEITATVRDAEGNVVHTANFPPNANPQGDGKWTWNGEDEDGVRQPEGSYSVSFEAKEGEKVLAIDDLIEGRVEGIRYDAGVPRLRIDGRLYALADVMEVVGGE